MSLIPFDQIVTTPGYMLWPPIEGRETMWRAHRSHSQNPSLWIMSYPVVAYTPRGKWICYRAGGTSRDKWIGDYQTKRWAWETPQQAIESYLQRTRRHLMYLKRKTDEVTKGLQVAQKILDDPPVDFDHRGPL